MRKLPLILTGSIIALISGLSAQAFLWDGGGADDNWGTGANWSPDGAPSTGTGIQIDFAGSTRLTPFWNYGSFDQMGSIFFDSGAGAFTLNGANAMKVFSKIENSGTTLQTVSISSIVLNGTAATEFNPVSGDLVINSALILDTPQLRIFGSSGKTVTFNGVISNGSATNPSVAINQNSNVVYQNAMTYTGDTFVNAGKLQFSTGGSAANSSIRIGDTATTAVAAEVDLLPSAGGLTLSNTFNSRAGNTGTATIASQNTSNSNTLSGHIALDKNLTITQAAGGTLAITQGRSTASGTTAGIDIKTFTLTFSGGGKFIIGPESPTTFGTIYDSASGSSGAALVMTGTGSLSLNDANSYRGETQVNSGTLFVGANNALGSSNGTIGTTGNTVLLGDNTGSSNATLLTTGAFTVANAITLQSGNTGVITIGGNSANASIFSGAVKLGTASGTAKNGVFVALSGGSAEFQGSITENTSVPASSVTIGDATHAGTVKFSNASNGYGGTTTIGNGATLEVVNLGTTGNSSIGNATRSTASNLVLSNGALKYVGTGESTSRSFTFDANGGALDASAAANGALTLTGTAAASGTGNRTLTLTGTSTGLNTMRSVIANPSSGATSVTKSGAGKWVLSGSNTYTGATLVSNGTLEAGAINALKTTSGITVNTGGTLLLSGSDNRIGDAVPLTLGGGTFHTGGLSETLGTLTLSANSIIDFGNGTSTLTFADSSGATWAGSFRLSIYNWSGNTLTGGGTDQLRFLSNGLSSTQLARIDFYSGSTAETKLSITPSFFANGFVGGAGEVTPVPEPSSVAAVMGLLGLIGWRERRKMLRERAADRRMILA